MDFEILAGDFHNSVELEKSWSGEYFLKTFDSKIKLNNNIKQIEKLTEEKAKSFLGAAGMGIAGGLLFGGIGAVAGILAGGNKQKVCFSCYLKNGKRFMAKSDLRTYQDLTALAFN